MASVIQFVEITNTTGDVLGFAPANAGDTFASQGVRRIFSADDVGTGTGQTRDTTSNPTQGCLVAQFSGSRIRRIKGLQLWRSVTATHVTDFNMVVTGTGANTVSIGLSVSYDPKKGQSNIYLIDMAADAPGQVEADDWIEFDVEFGDSETVAPWV